MGQQLVRRLLPAAKQPAAEAKVQEAKPRNPPGYHWRRMVAKAQERKAWSAKGHALNYAKNGMPQNLDGPAKGFGKHMGRWGYREIASEWGDASEWGECELV